MSSSSSPSTALSSSSTTASSNDHVAETASKANDKDDKSATKDRTFANRKMTKPAAVAHHAADVTRRMVCGGLAGMIAKTATNPLERIKMLSQTGEHGGAGTTSVIQLYRRIIQTEGVIGLWAGNGANLLRVFPAKAVVFGSNDYYKKALHVFSKTPANQPLAGHWAFLAGGLAGMSATLLTYPLDLARGRISGKLAHAPGNKAYRGIIATILLTVRDEGLFALYKGVTPTLIGAMPYEGIKFGTVGLLEKYFPIQKDENNKDNNKWKPLRKMLFGGMGGIMAGFITYPNDTVRRLLQLQGSRGTTTQFTGYIDCVRKTYAAHGIARFYRGWVINVVRMAPNAAVQFGSYEILKQWSAPYFQ